MKLLRHPVAQFLVFGLLLITLISFGTTRLAQEAAEQEALAEARDLNASLGRSLLDQPQRADALRQGRPSAIDAYDREVQGLLLVGYLGRVNIWDESGTLLYSNAFSLIGAGFDLSTGQEAVLDDGGTGSEFADPTSPENLGVEGSPGMRTAQPQQQVRIYTQVRPTPGRPPLLFEGYYTLTDIEDRREGIYDSFRWITIGGPLLLVLIATPLIWVLTRRLTSAGKDRERLLHSSLDASDAERRRIARDLHDGVVQDLAGTSFELSCLATRTGTDPALVEDLEAASRSLRVSMRSLRSLLVEIYPPDLGVTGLAAALDDLLSPLAAVGIETSLDVALDEEIPPHLVQLTWRVVQEAVRNAARHSRADHLAVTVVSEGALLVAEVLDDGIGWDASTGSEPGHVGLRGMATLVQEAGGRLVVESRLGQGMRVGMELITR